jgi:hypothetical protein
MLPGICYASGCSTTPKHTLVADAAKVGSPPFVSGVEDNRSRPEADTRHPQRQRPLRTPSRSFQAATADSKSRNSFERTEPTAIGSEAFGAKTSKLTTSGRADMN